MISRKTAIAIGVMLFASCLHAESNLADQNYDTSITKQQTGVDIQRVVDCGSDYATSNCNPSSSTSSGYGKNQTAQEGKADAKTLDANGSITDNNSSTLSSLGINSMGASGSSYNNSQDIASQQSEVADLTSKWQNSDISSLKATYNTGALPTNQGEDFKYKCMRYTDAKLSEMVDSNDAATQDLANQCLSVRTVSNTNDTTLANKLSKTDGLRGDVAKRATANKLTNDEVSKINSKVSNEKKANSMSYACDLSPTTQVTLSSTCGSRGVGRQQICKQVLTTVCSDTAQGTRTLPECVSGMDKGTVQLYSSSTNHSNIFSSDDNGFHLNDKWNDGRGRSSDNTWEITFLVKNPQNVQMILSSFYYDNKVNIYLNNILIASADNQSTDGTVTPNLNLYNALTLGKNVLRVELHNYDGPAGVGVNIQINPSSYAGCNCKESWVTTCSLNTAGL